MVESSSESGFTGPILAVTAIGVIVWFFVAGTRNFSQAVRVSGQMHRERWVIEMLCLQIKREGTWPTSWDDLEDEFQEMTYRYGNFVPLQELQERVYFNRDLSLEEAKARLEVAPAAVFHGIGVDAPYWDGESPAELLLQALDSVDP